ncbi:hypothetical protein BDR06DRAFT_1003738 [Suillus hirtellus]|nr:hypothetical protein BDR06DRAFT_1003738 [Suillus hirtellus]
MSQQSISATARVTAVCAHHLRSWQQLHDSRGSFSFRSPHSPFAPQCHPEILTFQFNDLGKEVTIMLAWSPSLDGLYEDFF